MENNTPEYEQRIERLRKSLGNKFGDIEDVLETNIRKGVGVTSLYTIKPSGIQVFSKCYKPELYKDILQEYIIDDRDALPELVSEKFDKNKILWEYEAGIIKGLNQISAGIKDNERFPKNLAPQFYGNMPEEERFLMEYITSPSFKQKFIEIDKQLAELYDKVEKNDDLFSSIVKLEDEKTWFKGLGLYYIARFHYLCEKNKTSLFGNIGERKRKEEFTRQKDYLEKMLIDFYPDFTKEELGKYLLKEKGVNIDQVVSDSLDIKKTFTEKLSIIHGDFGVQHLTTNGICFDFDEFRLDLVQDDIVRFLNNEFSPPYTEEMKDSDERKTPGYLADYFIDRKRLEGRIKWEDKFTKSKEALLNDYGLKNEFLDFLVTYYCERLEEDIHIYAINKSTDPERLKIFSEEHPKLKSIDDFQKYRINDINRALSFLLGTKYGREKILRDHKEATNFFETMRSFFEKSGIIKAERFGENESGMLDI